MPGQPFSLFHRISTSRDQVDIFVKSEAYLERLDHPTPMTRVVMSEIFKDMNRTVCERTFRRGIDMRGSTAVAVRFDECPNESSVEGYDRDFWWQKRP